MRFIRQLALAAAAALGLAVPAGAAPLTGTFTIQIYQGFGGGTITSPGVQAVNTNPLIVPGNLKDTVSYTGQINFFLGSGATNSIGAFLNSGTGSYTGLSAGTAGLLLSAGGFGTTTVLRITGSQPNIISGTITHDDGIGLYQGGSLVTAMASTAPTTPIGTPFSLNPGAFELIYVAANNLPEQLNVNVTSSTPPGGGPSEVPTPGALALFGAALLGLGALGRRRAA